jgi:uridine kinase
MLVEYVAVCLNIRGEILGMRRIGIETGTGVDQDKFLADVKVYFEREFFITLIDANFGRPIEWQKGKIEQGRIRVGQVRSGRYEQGKAIGLIVTGTDIKTVALVSGDIMYREQIAISPGNPLGDVIEECIVKAAREIEVSRIEEENIYIGVPGPVDPWGNITRLSESAGVTKEELELLQKKYPKICFINDANVEAAYHRIVWAGDIATSQPTVSLVLRKGIGFAILVEGQSLSWVGAPMETHFRANFADDAPICNCGMKGCLELSAGWLVSRFQHLMLNSSIELPPSFTGILFGELARLMGVSGFWVVLSGGMAYQRKQREEIIKGFADGIDSKFPGLRIEILRRTEETTAEDDIIRYERTPENWQGAVGAALCALQDKQMKMGMEPDVKMMIDEAEEAVSSEIAEIFRTERKLSVQTIIGAAGASGGGKSYFIKTMQNRLEELSKSDKHLQGMKAEVIMMDDYLIQKENRERGGIRAKYALQRLWGDLMAINTGHTIYHPIFDQVSRVRYTKLGRFLDEKTCRLGYRLSEKNTGLFRWINHLTEWSGDAVVKLKPGKNTIVIVDGILSLDDPVINKLYYDYRIFVHAPWIWRLCAAICRAQQEKWYKGANTADIIEKFVFKRPEEEAIINVTYLDADIMVENDFYEKSVNSTLEKLLGDVYASLDKTLHAQYYIVYALMEDQGYCAKAIFEEKLESINELILESRIEDLYEEDAGIKLMEKISIMAESCGYYRDC